MLIPQVQKSGLVGNKLDFWLTGCGFESHCILYYMEMAPKPCQDRFLYPIQVYFNKKDNQEKYTQPILKHQNMDFESKSTLSFLWER